CDQACMNLFDKAPMAPEKIPEYAVSDQEFVKSAAFALIAATAVHDKKGDDTEFVAFFPLIKAGATDERNFVKKSVNWALRSIGKRNANLNKAALQLARELEQ